MGSQATSVLVDYGLWEEADLWPRRDHPPVRAELTSRFMAFSKSIAIKYAGMAESTDDLIQVASLGLMNAIERFEPENGAPFIAFASVTINGEIKRHFRDRVSGIRLPRDIYERIGNLERTAGYLRGELSREPTDHEMAEAMGCSEAQVREAREAVGNRHPISFGREHSDGDEAVLEDRVGFCDEGFSRSENHLLVSSVLDQLGTWDRKVILLRFRDELSQSQIAERLGCSQMHVSRSLRRILDSLADRLAPSGS